MGTRLSPTRLLDSQVAALRRDYAAGATQAEISKRYKVSLAGVACLVVGLSRREAGGPIARPKTHRGLALDRAVHIGVRCEFMLAQRLAARARSLGISRSELIRRVLAAWEG